jgi:hypothetical protein
LTAAAALTVMLCVRIDRSGFQCRRDAVFLAVSIALGMGVKHLYVAFVGLPLVFLFASALLTGKGGWLEHVKRRWFLLGCLGAGVLLGISYHLLNMHIVSEQLRRSKDFAATGAKYVQPPLWIVFTGLLGKFGVLWLVLFAAGAVLVVWISRRRSLYLLLWVAGGWIGVAVAASAPISYYLLPLLPGLTLLGSGLLAFDWIVPAKRTLRVVSVCAAGFMLLVLMRYMLRERLGTADPGRLLAGVRMLARSHGKVRENPFSTTDYWSEHLVSGNEAILPYPQDWKTDEMVAAISELVNGREAGSQTVCWLFTNYESMNFDLLRYHLERTGLSVWPEEMAGRVIAGQPLELLSQLSSGRTGMLEGAQILIFKSGTPLEPGGEGSDSTVEKVLANDGAILRQEGFVLHRAFELPDQSEASIWVASRTMLSHDLFRTMPSATVLPSAGPRVAVESFDIGGETRTVLFEASREAPAVTKVEWSGLWVTPTAHLKFGIAIEPGVYWEKSDGVDFEIELWDGGRPRRIFSKYLDPSHNPADRQWSDFDIPLNASGVAPVDVYLITRPGPKNDATFDHSAWSGLQIVP